MSLFIETSLDPSLKDVDFLGRGIYEEARNKKGMRPPQAFGFFLKNDKRATVGGLNGFCYYGCLYIDQLYIEAAYRGQGWGRKLVKAAEDFGANRQCALFTVTTMEWEARGFYEKLGYVLEFSRSGYDNDSIMYFLHKRNQLSAPSNGSRKSDRGDTAIRKTFPSNLKE